MAQSPTRKRILGASAASLFVALGLSASSCAADRSDEAKGPEIKNVKQLIYAVRQTTFQNEDGSVGVDVSGGANLVIDYLRYVPGGRVELLDLASGHTQNLTAAYPKADISSLDLNFEGTRAVFSMKQDADDNYHIYWVALQPDADGNREMHQLTFGDADDVFPTYLAGDKIAFATNQGYTAMGTRADEYNHARVVSQIATITLTGGDADRKLCSQNLSHTVNLFAMKDGRVGFSRWEHLELVNDAKLFAMNPDCTQMIALSGQHSKPAAFLVQASETNTQNVFLAIGTARNRTIQAGAILRIDARNPDSPNLFYEEEPSYEILTEAVPRDKAPSPVGRYRLPISLPDGRILVSWAPGFVNTLNELSMTPPDFGVYLYDPKTRLNQLVKNYEGSWEVYAKPVIKREQPPIIGSIQDTADLTLPTVFGSVDIKQTSLFSLHQNRVSGAQFDDTPLDEALKQARKVRVIEGFSSEAATGVTMFGLTLADGAAMLGEATIYDDGSWMAALPPYLPVHLQPIDEFDMAIRNQTLWIQGMPGEDRICGGCHESRKNPILPGGQALTTAASKGPENFNGPIADRQEYPWYEADPGFEANEIQKILDAKCVSCHNASTTEYYTVTMTNSVTGTSTPYQIPRLDLSTTPITVTYDNRTATYPVSYVSLFYPGAMRLTTLQVDVSGTVPPVWARPSDARNSALIEKLNMTSSLDQNKTAWKLGEPFSDPDIKGNVRTMHPEDKGVELTRDERRALIRAIDMGGQYYARQNTQFAPYQNDPIASGGQQYP
jgi:hypothetical protein